MSLLVIGVAKLVISDYIIDRFYIGLTPLKETLPQRNVNTSPSTDMKIIISIIKDIALRLDKLKGGCGSI